MYTKDELIDIANAQMSRGRKMAEGRGRVNYHAVLVGDAMIREGRALIAGIEGKLPASMVGLASELGKGGDREYDEYRRLKAKYEGIDDENL